MPRRTTLAALVAVSAAASYKAGDDLKILATHVGPVANPSETYPFFVLPYCGANKDAEAVSQDLGESLSGDYKVATPYTVKFGVNEDEHLICEKDLTEDEIDRFSTAIEEEWYGELVVDDLPMWIYVGDSEKEDFLLGHTENSRHYLYTHFHFTFGVNGDQIVTANVTASPDHRADITLHDPSHAVVPDLGSSGGHGHGHGRKDSDSKPVTMKVKFTYSVSFVPSDVAFESRMEVYTASSSVPSTLEIHWLSIVNSLVLVVLLTAFLAIILMRVVRNDFTRYMRVAEDEESGAAAEEETGWKLLHGDVFRPPPNLSLFAAMVGAGAHLFVMTLALLSLAVLGSFSLARRGSIVAACIILYVLTAFVGGYISARVYKRLKGGNWVWNVMLNLVMLPAPLAATFTVLNTTAMAKQSTAALPVGTVMVVLALFLFIAFPLCVLGGIAGHNAKEFEPPCRVSKVPRQVPALPVYRSALAQLFMSGFLPFSAISIELHYIFASLWGHKVYTLYGILFLAFGLLTVVTAFITIALTYFQLAAEDHRWWWRSFLSGGSVGLFIFAYCFFYYYNHSGMSGFLQTAFYFLYMANVSFAFVLMMGFIGFYAAFAFVKYIYRAIKTD